MAKVAPSIFDLLLVPLFLGIVVLVGYALRNWRYRHEPVAYRHFMPVLLLNLGGALGVGIIYFYFYGGGDTFHYFINAENLAGLIAENPQAGLRLWYEGLDKDSSGELQFYAYNHRVYFASVKNAYMVVRVVTLFSWLTFGSYWATAVLMGFLSFLGIWGLYRYFVYHFPDRANIIALATLYVPSVLFWGSGILKDSICIACVGIVLNLAYKVLLKPNLTNLLLVPIAVFAAIICFQIKSYIIIGLIPFFFLWLALTYKNQIRNAFLRVIVTPLLLTAMAAGAYFGLQSVAALSDRYSLDRVLETAEVTYEDLQRDYYYQQSGESSRYDLGEFDATVPGILSKFPLATLTGFFRPFLWEANNILVLVAALESTLLIVLFLRVMVRVGPLAMLRYIAAHPFLIFLLSFSVFFAFMTGLTSGNFGNLSRYRIPMIPFFLTAMVILEDRVQQKRREKKQRAEEQYGVTAKKWARA